MESLDNCEILPPRPVVEGTITDDRRIAWQVNPQAAAESVAMATANIKVSARISVFIRNGLMVSIIYRMG